MDQHQRDSIALQQAQATHRLVGQLSSQSSPKGKPCPYCGGDAIQNYERCKNCASVLSWVEGVPCKPEQESSIAQKFRAAREQAAREQQAKKIAVGIPRHGKSNWVGHLKLILWVATMLAFGIYAFLVGG